MTRGIKRIEMARKLLRLPPDSDVMAHIKNMTEEKREWLRGLVDWVEAYENSEVIA